MTADDLRPSSDIDIRMAITTELFMFTAAVAFFASALYGLSRPTWIFLWLNLTPLQALETGGGFLLVGAGFELFRRRATKRWHRDQTRRVRDLKAVEIVFVGEHAVVQKVLEHLATTSRARFSRLDHVPEYADPIGGRVVVWYPGKAQDPREVATATAAFRRPVVVLASRDQKTEITAFQPYNPSVVVLTYPFIMGTLLNAVERLAVNALQERSGTGQHEP